MQRPLLLALPFIATTALQAQTLTSADMPVNGESFLYIGAAYTHPAATGENITWDLSTLVPTDTTVLDCILPEATSYASQFPDADIVLSQTNIQQFMRVDTSGLYEEGLWNGFTNVVVRFTDDYEILPFPLNYGTTFSDVYGGGYDAGSQHVDVTGNVSFTVDGYGTLVLPWGTLTNVLKVSGTEVSDELLQQDVYETTSDIVYFFKPGIHFFLLKAMDISVTLNDAPVNSGQVLSFMDQTSVGVAELVHNDIGLDAFPVPAHDRLNVVYGLDGGHAIALELLDASGRAVRSLGGITGATGIQRSALDVAGLPAGLYLLRITDDRGQRGTRPVVLE